MESKKAALPQADDSYAALSRFYDSENAGFDDDLPAYLLMAERFEGPVLDVGCGTGRVTFPLADAGFRVVGVDNSPSMLAIACKAAESRQAAHNIEWVVGDMARLDLPGEFGLALIAYNGFTHLLTQEQQVNALCAMARHLRQGGGVVLDMPNPMGMFILDAKPGMGLERTFTDIETGHPVMQFSSTQIDRAEQIVEVTWLYDRISPSGEVFRTAIPVRFRLCFAPELTLMMRQAGLDTCELYGDYSFSPYEEDSPRLFAVGVKRG